MARGGAHGRARSRRRRRRARPDRRRSRCRSPTCYPVAEPSLARPGADKLALLRRADAAARAYDPRIVRVEASLAEEIREILVVTSDGHLARDRQPLIRFGVRAVAEEGGKRQGGRSGGGGRFGMEYFAQRRAEPRGARARGGAARDRACSTRVEAPAGEMEVVLGAGRLRHPAARGGRPRARGRLQPQGDLELHRPDRQAGRVAAVHRRRRRHDRQRRAARSTSTTRATPGQRNVLIENGIAGRLHARPAVARSTSARSRRATAAARAFATSRCRA